MQQPFNPLKSFQMAFRHRWPVCLAALLGAVLPLAAGNIDVTTQSTVPLNTGDVLFFSLQDWNFVEDANSFGISPYPSAVSFQLVTAPLAGSPQFTVDLESSGGTVLAALPGPVSAGAGVFHGTFYNGPVSTISGTFFLSTTASQQLFGGSAILAVYNDGAPLSLGLAPYTIGQDMLVSLSGSGLSVGAPQGSVILDPPEPIRPRTEFGVVAADRRRAVRGPVRDAEARFPKARIRPSCPMDPPDRWPTPPGQGRCRAIGHQPLRRRLHPLGLRYHLGGRSEILPLKCRKSNQRSKIIN